MIIMAFCSHIHAIKPRSNHSNNNLMMLSLHGDTDLLVCNYESHIICRVPALIIYLITLKVCIAL